MPTTSSPSFLTLKRKLAALTTSQSFDAGTVIKTAVPSQVTLTNLDVCSEVLADESLSPLTCSFEEATHTLQFSIASTTSFDQFEFVAGTFLNPGTETLIFGFAITIEDQNGQQIDTANAAPLQIVPNLVYDQSLTAAGLKVRQETSYTFTFAITNNVPAGGYLKIFFPSADISVPSGLTDSQTSVQIYS